MIAAFWRRLDTLGTDAARLSQVGGGWRLGGTAVFLHEKQPTRLEYELQLNADWTTASGAVRGFRGDTMIDQVFQRDGAGWSMNGARVPGLEQVADLDFGFTPATNFAQLRRIALRVGDTADFSVAWWDVDESTLVGVPQHYRRCQEDKYWYESPTVSYREMLELAGNGFVRHYPRLWALESE